MLKYLSFSSGKPSVELSVVSSVDKSATQKLLCSGTGFNPKITWFPNFAGNASSKVTVEADGHMKVSSETLLPLQTWNNGDTFTCTVRGQDNVSVQKSISACKGILMIDI